MRPIGILFCLLMAGCAAAVRPALPPKPGNVVMHIDPVKGGGYFMDEANFHKLLNSLKERQDYQDALEKRVNGQ